MKQLIVVALILPDESDIDTVIQFIKYSAFELYSEPRIMDLHPFTLPVSGETKYETCNSRMLEKDDEGELVIKKAGRND